MRFAYIDSHGNEVPIPSVDALALRIELGAIGPDTDLYDAQADLWGPAHTHEIFHTLSRTAEEEGFVAPPPPVAPTPGTEQTEPEADPEPVVEAAAPLEEVEPEEEEADLELTLAAPPAEAEPSEDVAEPESADELDLDLAPAPTAVPPEPEDDLPLLPDEEPEPAGAAVEEVPGQDGGFDFGDMSGGLELEGSALDTAPPEVGGDMEVETAMEFASPEEGVGDIGGGLELEQPMSEFQPDAPPGWMEAGETDDVMDFSSISAEAAPAEEGAPPEAGIPARQRRSSKDRPSPPKFKRQRSLSGPIILVVILLALGVGGYVAWPIVSARLAQGDEPERPPVQLPTIPEELVPQMRSLAEAAMDEALAQVAGETAVAGMLEQPGEAWLGGEYLGNASRFQEIADFWSGIDAFTQGVRAAGWQLYHDKYVEQAQAAGLDAETAALLTERADSGFVAAEEGRLASYAALERVVDAALELHDFLLANEENIEYRPAATSTADPILEAVPTTSVVGDQMLARVSATTGALLDLEASFPFTRERLRSALLERLKRDGFQ